MTYEIVELSEKKVVGLTTRTSNSDPDMSQKIGELWTRFYSEGINQTIPHQANECSIGLYSDYESDVNGSYDATVCCEVTNFEDCLKGVQQKIIPAGKYAKFIVCGPMQTVIGDFWKAFWTMDLDRKYTSDFEEYQSGGSMEHCEVHIYVAIK